MPTKEQLAVKRVLTMTRHDIDLTEDGMSYADQDAILAALPAIQRALALAEAVEWMRAHGATITIRRRGMHGPDDSRYGFIVTSRDNHHSACSHSISEAVSALRAKLETKES